MTKLHFCFLFCLTITSIAAAIDVDVPKEIPNEPLEITAARIEYTNDTVIASGGVTGRYEKVVITADRISGNTRTGDLRVEGGIHFQRENVVWQGSSLDYNYLTQTGNFGPSSLDFDPILMSVDYVERVSTNEYLLKGATFTTCKREHTHYHVRVKEATLVDEKYLKAKGATFYIGSIPVLYVPYWRQTLSKSIFTFGAGARSEWGVYGMIKATVPWTPHFDAISDLNVYSRRGVGIGQGFAWNYPHAVGEFSAFYLKDQDPNARYDLPQIDEDRYRFKLEHLQHFTDTHYLNTKWNHLSDPVILDEFFKQEYRRYAQPENYASWVYGNEHFGHEAFINYRLNDFYTNTDRIQYSADLYRTRLGNSPFYFKSENTVAYLERVYSDTNTVDSAYDSVRLDSANTLYWPQRYGFLNLVPRASYRATYYSKNNTGSDEMRHIPGVGVEASFQAVKVLSTRERWYGKGLRHKIEPYADYSYEDASVGSSQLRHFDAIDNLDDTNKTKLGLRNVLQTKRNDHVSRFIDLDLHTYYLGAQDGAQNDFDSLFVDARMPLTKRTMVDMEGEVDWNNGEVPFFDTRFTYRRRDLRLSMEHLYREDANKSLWTSRAEVNPEGKWTLEGYARYEDKSTDLEEIAVTGYVNWCCMRYGLGCHYYDGNEFGVMLSIGLSAFPEARMESGF